MKLIISIHILIFSVHLLPAQCGPELAATRADMDARRYQAAIDKLLILQKECPKDAAQIAAMIKETFEMIEGEKLSAENAQKEAEAERDRANRVLSRIYFYEDKFGLTMERKGNQNKYGFIDRNGETVIPFEFDEAGNFSIIDGYARVTKGNKRYLLNTDGDIFKLTTHVDSLHEESEALDISNQKVDSLPKNIGEYAQLRIILARENELSYLPNGIGHLSQLHTLVLDWNYLTRLPESIANLSQLQTLFLFNNNLTSLPENIGDLTQLKTLGFSGRNLYRLPDSFTKLQQLKKLHVSGGLYPPLLENITRLAHLQELYLSYNILPKLPVQISSLAKLRILYLAGNNLTKLPESIAKLGELRTLDLSENQLTALPENISNLSQLQSLNLRNNKLSSLPQGITKLGQLRELDLRNNPFSEPEKKRIKQTFPFCKI